MLKNESGALPLTPPDPEAGDGDATVAVIGHLGTTVLTDWYSGSLPYAVTIADGLRTAFGDTAVTAVDDTDVINLRAGEAVFGPFCGAHPCTPTARLRADRAGAG